MKIRTNKKLLLLISTAMLSGSVVAHAEEDDNRLKEVEFDEMIVTGSGRAAAATSIPLNISAIGEAELRRRNITDIKQLIADSVEISAPGNNNRVAESVTVRGLNVAPVNSNNLEQFIRTTIAYYLDDTPLPNIAYRIKDIERVETLFGPQGTLYGAGSLGGTIRYITNQPKLDALTFDANASLYQVKYGGLSYDVDFVLNAPLSETVAIRASIAHLDDAGFTDRIANPVFFEDDVLKQPQPNADQNLYEDDDWEETTSGKIALLWQASDDLAITLTHIQQEQLAHGTRGASRLPVDEACEQAGLVGDACDARFPNRFSTPFQVNDHTIVSTYDEFSERDFIMDSIDLDWDLGFATLSSNTSYFKDQREGQADYLGNGILFYGFIPGLGLDETDQSAFILTDNEYKGWNHETRLSSTTDGPLQWILGFYFTSTKSRLQFSEFYPGFDEAAANSFLGFDRVAQFGDTRLGELDEGYHENFFNRYREVALFGEVTYSVTDRLDLTAGARVFHYNDENDRQIVDYTGISNGISQSEVSGEEIFFKFNAAYSITDDILAYATFSQGFRRGGTNGFRDDVVALPGDGGTVPLVVAEDSQNFIPDSTDNYELGIKGNFFDEKLYVQANVYHIDWTNVQTFFTQTIDDFFPLNGSTNGPSARSRGFELSMRYRVTDEITLRYATATTSAKWTDSLERCIFAPVPEVPDANLQCRSWNEGGNLGGAPDWRHNFGISFDKDIGEGYFSAHFDGRYVGTVPSDRRDFPDDDVYTRPSYTTFSASIVYGRENWKVSLWGENITDNRAETSGQFTSEGERAIFVRPRTIGLNFSYSYN